MALPIVTKAVSLRLGDSSISVREAAVALIGLHVVQYPAVAQAFPLVQCLQDPGVSVRKRTVRMFAEIWQTQPNYRGRAAVSQAMLERAMDPKEEDGVRDLIYQLFDKLWLEDLEAPSPVALPRAPPAPAAATSPERRVVVTPPSWQTPPTMAKRSDVAAHQMMQVVRGSGSADHVEFLLKQLVPKKVGACRALVDSLVELLLSTEETKAKRRVGRDLAAVFQTIAVFSQLDTASVLKHFDVIVPYLKADNAERSEDEAAIVGAVCEIVHRLAGNLGAQDLHQLPLSLAQDFGKIIYRFQAKTLSFAVDALSSLAQHPKSSPDNLFRKKLVGLSRTFYSYLVDKQSLTDLSALDVSNYCERRDWS